MFVSKWLWLLILAVPSFATIITPTVHDLFLIVDGNPPVTDPVPVWDPITQSWVLDLDSSNPPTPPSNGGGVITEPADDVTLLPEPASNALMVLGLGGIALARLVDRSRLRSRRNQNHGTSRWNHV